MTTRRTYVQVILPLRFRDTVTYSVPGELVPQVSPGSRVEVMLGYRKYKGFVEEVTYTPKYDVKKIKNIISVDPSISATKEDIRLWRTISDYYMCSSGEALKAATPFLMELQTKREKKTGTKTAVSVPEQGKNRDLGTESPFSVPERAIQQIHTHLESHKTVLIKESSGQDRYTLYPHLAYNTLQQGKSILILTPDIPSCRKMEKLFSPLFGTFVITYHSGQTTAKRREATKAVLQGTPLIIIGLRSALFLPFRNLGMIIVDQEHDHLYKQTEPTPRYHGRDTALILAQIHKAGIVLGSATPSFESLHNALTGKYSEVNLNGAATELPPTTLQIIDFNKELRNASTKGPITNIALVALRESAEKGIKGAIFRPKWAFPQGDEWREELSIALGNINTDIYTDLSELEALKTKPSLIVVLQGEALLSPKNFRADEKVLHQISKLVNITRGGKTEGRVIVQTSLFRHNVFRLLAGRCRIESILDERKEANLPPFSRMVQITVKGGSVQELAAKGEAIAECLKRAGAEDFDGPIPTSDDAMIFQIRLPKEKRVQTIKQKIAASLYHYENIIIDVDPC